MNFATNVTRLAGVAFLLVLVTSAVVGVLSTCVSLEQKAFPTRW